MVALSKPDIKRAMWQFLLCQREEGALSDRESSPSSGRALAASSSHPMPSAQFSSVEFSSNIQSNDFQVDLPPSVELGLDVSNQEREQRQTRATRRRSSHTIEMSGDDEWDAEDVWEEEQRIDNTMHTITE